jgi:hypothetical protein
MNFLVSTEARDGSHNLRYSNLICHQTPPRRLKTTQIKWPRINLKIILGPTLTALTVQLVFNTQIFEYSVFSL